MFCSYATLQLIPLKMVKGLSKKQNKTKHKNMVVTKGKRGQREAEEGKEGGG